MNRRGRVCVGLVLEDERLEWDLYKLTWRDLHGLCLLLPRYDVSLEAYLPGFVSRRCALVAASISGKGQCRANNVDCKAADSLSWRTMARDNFSANEAQRYSCRDSNGSA